MELRVRILTIAYNLISKYSITSVTMDTIAKECGISKRTLYEVFADKHSLILESLKMAFKERDCKFEEIIITSENMMVAMLRIYGIIRDEISRVSHAFYMDMHRLYPELFNEYRSMQALHVEYLTNIFKQGAKEGVFVSDINYEIVGKLYFIQIEGTKENQDLFGTKIPIVDVFDTIFTAYFRGIASEKGRKILDKVLSQIKKVK